MNGAEVLLKALEDQGVDTIFGYPGGAVLEIYEALKGSPIRHVLARHEQGAAHEASGYARASGKVGVCLATSGPGATNLVTGIATANMDSIPLLAITGQVATRLIGTDAFQETDITGIVNPITKHNVLVQDAADLPRLVAEAVHIATTGRPGPVLLDIPRDVSQQILDYQPHGEVDIRSYKPTLKGNELMIKKAARMIKEAENMAIIVGGGVVSARAGEEIAKIAALKNCPVVATMMGIGGIPASDPHFIGMLGTYGALEANQAVQDADVILAFGTRFDDRIINAPHLFGQKSAIIHVDVDPAEIGKNVAPKLPIVGDVKLIAEQILARLEYADDILDNHWREKAFQRSEPRCAVPRVLDLINDITDPATTIFTTDVGQHQVWAANYLKIEEPGHFISSGGLGTMGYGLPAAVGAQVARPEDLVILITGDGSLQMGMNELGTILAEGLPVKILLFNNSALGMVRQLQYHYFEKNYSQVDFQTTVDFAKLMDAYGFKAHLIERFDQARPVLEQALHEPGCSLIECRIPADDKCLPIVLAGKPINDMYDEA